MTAPNNPTLISTLSGSLRKKSETVIFLPLHAKNRKEGNISHCLPPVFVDAAWTDKRDILASSVFMICFSASRLLTFREDTVLSSLAIDSNRTVSRSNLLWYCFWCAFQAVARSCIFFAAVTVSVKLTEVFRSSRRVTLEFFCAKYQSHKFFERFVLFNTPVCVGH